MRFPHEILARLPALLGLVALPAIWWAPPIEASLIVVLLGAVAFLLARRIAPPTSGAHQEAPARANAEGAPGEGAGAASSLAALSPFFIGAALALGFSLALMAFFELLAEPVFATRAMVSTLLLSRILLLIVPASRGELARLVASHVGSLAVIILALGASGAADFFCFQAIWFLVDGSRLRFIEIARPSSAKPLADVASPANDHVVSSEQVTEPGAPDGASFVFAPLEDPVTANDEGAPSSPPLAATDSEATVETTASAPEANRPEARKLRPADFAAIAAASIAAWLLVSIGAVNLFAGSRPAAQMAQSEQLGAAVQSQSDEAPETAPPVSVEAALDSACANANVLEANGLGVLTASAAAGHNSGVTDMERPAVASFAALPLVPASPREADRVFGKPCPNDDNLRIVEARRLRQAHGVSDREALGPRMVIGAVFALRLPDGRRILIARGAAGEAGEAPGHLLMAWSPYGDAGARTRTIWVVSTKGQDGVPAALFAPQAQPLGGFHLWYGGMGPDGVADVSTADVIDVSGSVPRNTGVIPVWAASSCGQVPGAPLMTAEPNCAEQPAWSFWMTDFDYEPNGADAVDVTFAVRRQTGRPGEPASYDAPLDDRMHARFVLGGEGWRLEQTDAPLLAEAGFQLASN